MYSISYILIGTKENLINHFILVEYVAIFILNFYKIYYEEKNLRNLFFFKKSFYYL
jgi:hypothetical protein